MRGVAHVHSTYSFDGRLRLPELAQFLAERGMDFALLSEHVESLQPETLREFFHQCQECSNDAILLIPGVEIDGLNALLFGIRHCPEQWMDWEDLARQLISAGALTAVSHPCRIVKPVPALIRRHAEAVEVWNSRYDGKMALRLSSVRYWRSLMTQEKRALRPMCGIDFHDRRDYCPLMLEVQCAERDSSAILASLRAGQYRMVHGGRPVPLDFHSGALPIAYRSFAALSGAAHSAVYGLHRQAVRMNLRPPRPVKRWLARWF